MVHKWFHIQITKICIKKQECFIWWPHVPFMTCNSNGQKMCSPICLSNCRLFRRAETFYHRTTKRFQWKWKQVNYGAITKRYIDDSFTFWPLELNFENFNTCLNNMHPLIKFTYEKPEVIYENGKKVKVFNSRDIKIILHEDNSVEKDLYYKLTNTHNYLPWDSAHPDHTKNNIPYNKAKRIIVFRV